jgi:hypothetical protein
MTRCLIFFLILLFLQVMEPGFAQSLPDSVERTIINDSQETGTVDTAVTEERSVDLPIPIGDTGSLSKEIVRRVPQWQVNSYLNKPGYAYANDPAYWGKENLQKPGILFRILSSGLLQRIILLGFIIIGLYGIYRLVIENHFSSLFRKSKKTFSEPDEPATEAETDYEAAIRKYQSEGNYRQAIRFLYLRMIRTACDKSGLSIRDSSTNAEITLAFGSHPKAGEFRWLATAYEYIYYGEFHPKPEVFDMIRSKFEAFQQTLSR